MSKKILDVKAQELRDRIRRPPNRDDQFIRDALNSIPHLTNATNVTATPFMNLGFMKVYYLNIEGVPPKDQKLIAFVWNKLDKNILESCIWNAKKDTINGIMGVTNNALIVREFKLKGGSA
jgi:hypothetical protein